MGIGVRNLLKRCARDFARDDGVAGIVIAMVISIVAFTALTVFLNKYSGSTRDLAKYRETQTSFRLAEEAVAVDVIRDANRVLPCPANGAASTGAEVTPCDSGDGISGTIPWSALGVGSADAVDTFGSKLTYVVTPGNLQVCDTMGGIPTGEVSQGSLRIEPAGTTALYAIISHGQNRRGGFSAGGAALQTATSDNEEENCPSGGSCSDPDPVTIRTGPYTTDSADTYFDDIVAIGTSEQFESLCQSLKQDLPYNTTFTDEGFDTPGAYSSATLPSQEGGGTSDDATVVNGQLQMTEDVYLHTTGTLGDILRTNTTPLYVAVKWTPTLEDDNDEAFFSIVMRTDADDADRTTYDGAEIQDSFDQGITVRFGGNVTSGADNFAVRIFRDDGDDLDDETAGITQLANLSLNNTYLLEVFDDGDEVWARATEIESDGQSVLSGSNYNTATLRSSSVLDAGATVSRIAFINNAGGQSLIDDLLIAKGMWAVEVGSGASAARGYVQETTYADPDFNNSTIEFWIRTLDNPSYGLGGITDQENVSGPSGNMPRFRFNGATPGAVEFITAEGTNQAAAATLGFNTREWVHVAGVCENNTTTRLYINGTERTTSALACDGDPSGDLFLGALNAADANFFHGQISEFRVWSGVRTSSQILADMFSRVPGSSTNLHTSWRLDDGFGVLVADDAAAGAQDGTLGGSAQYVGAQSPIVSSASTICPSNFSTTLPNTCVYTADATISLSLDIRDITVKVWGGGGGGDSSGGGTSGNGGAGGYATATIASVGGVPVGGQQFSIVVGQGGERGSTLAVPIVGDINSGGAGGGGSSFSYAGVELLAAGGGGGAALDGTITANGGAGGGTNGVDGTGTCPGQGAEGATGGIAAICSAGDANPETGSGNAGENHVAGGDGSAVTNGLNLNVRNGGAGDGIGGFTDIVLAALALVDKSHGGGGGGGYAGGGAGGVNQGGSGLWPRSGAGGGGSGFINTTDTGITGESTTAGAATAPPNTTDASYIAATAQTGTAAGVGGTGAADGTRGVVIVSW